MKKEEVIKSLEKMLFEGIGDIKTIYFALNYIKGEEVIYSHPMAIGELRRRNLSTECLSALKKIRTGSLKNISDEISSNKNINGELNLLSKVATYMKRLETKGLVKYELKRFEHSRKPLKVYSLIES